MDDNMPLEKGMIDSHFHYTEMLKKNLDPEKIMASLFSSGLTAAIDVATGTSNHEKRLQFAAGFDRLFISSGISPGKAENSEDEILEMLDTLDTQLSDPSASGKTVAVGETGLDWYWNHGSRDRQILLFERQLELAEKHSLPVIIHNREADKDILDVLRRKAPSRSGVIHCFSSDHNFALSCIDLGFYISFAGNVTYKKNTSIQEAARKIPAEFILAETDSPYLSPQKVRHLPNNPGYVSWVYLYMAESRNIAVSKLIDTVRENFGRFTGKSF